MKRLLYLVPALIFAATMLTGVAAQQTWVGKISDSMCGAKHMAGEHGAKKVSDRDCTQACVKKGAKFVFVKGGTVFQISNQDFAGLQTHAGHTVRLTGDLASDGKTINVAKITMPGKKKA